MPSVKMKTADIAALSDEALRDLFANGGSLRSIRRVINRLLDDGITEVLATSEAIHVPEGALSLPSTPTARI